MCKASACAALLRGIFVAFSEQKSFVELWFCTGATAIFVAFSTEKYCGVVVLYRGDGPTRKNETSLQIKLLTLTLLAAVTLYAVIYLFYRV